MGQKKVKVVLLYGGESVEHDISCMSAKQIWQNLDRNRYDVHAVGIDKSGYWHPQSSDTLFQSEGLCLPIHPFSGCRKWAPDTTVTAGYSIRSLLLHMCGLSRNFESVTTNDLVVFPILHGTNGEDGTLQGLLELAGLPYVGSDTVGSVLAINKVVAKRLVAQMDIPILPYVTGSELDWAKQPNTLMENVNKSLEFPVFVKPTSLGSSVGVTRVTDEQGLDEACRKAFSFGNEILVEQGISGAREIECALLVDEVFDCSDPGEVIPNHDFYSYEAKYCDKNGAQIRVPAPLSSQMRESIRRMALAVAKGLNVYGMARVDFLLKPDTDQIYFNEMNTIPGFTSISQYYLLWENAGVPIAELLVRLVESGRRRFARRSLVKKTFSAKS